MPHLTLQISSRGPIVEMWVLASLPRIDALKHANKPLPSPVQTRALIDTGADCTAIDSTVLHQLGITPTGTTPIHTPSTQGSPHIALQFDVGIAFVHPVSTSSLHIGSIPVIQADTANQGFGALIGRDVLSRCLFVYDGTAHSFCLAF